MLQWLAGQPPANAVWHNLCRKAKTVRHAIAAPKKAISFVAKVMQVRENTLPASGQAGTEVAGNADSDQCPTTLHAANPALPILDEVGGVISYTTNQHGSSQESRFLVKTP